MSASILIPCKGFSGALFCATDYFPDDRIMQKRALPYIIRSIKIFTVN
jgi:hypothetical protein